MINCKTYLNTEILSENNMKATRTRAEITHFEQNLAVRNFILERGDPRKYRKSLGQFLIDTFEKPYDTHIFGVVNTAKVREVTLEEFNAISDTAVSRLCNRSRTRFDFTGMQIGLLTVLKQTEFTNKAGNVLWHAQCQCGNVAFPSGGELTSAYKKGKMRYCGRYCPLLIKLRESSMPRTRKKWRHEHDAWTRLVSHSGTNTKRQPHLPPPKIDIPVMDDNFEMTGSKSVDKYPREWQWDFFQFMEDIEAAAYPTKGKLQRLDKNRPHKAGNTFWVFSEFDPVSGLPIMLNHDIEVRANPDAIFSTGTQDAGELPVTRAYGQAANAARELVAAETERAIQRARTTPLPPNDRKYRDTARWERIRARQRRHREHAQRLKDNSVWLDTTATAQQDKKELGNG